MAARWSQSEIAYLREYYALLPPGVQERQLGRTWRAIRRKAFLLQLTGTPLRATSVRAMQSTLRQRSAATHRNPPYTAAQRSYLLNAYRRGDWPQRSRWPHVRRHGNRVRARLIRETAKRGAARSWRSIVNFISEQQPLC